LSDIGWLALNEYSTKYKVSLSTLRRRIRSNEIIFQFEDGKYWLPDQNMTSKRMFSATRPADLEAVKTAPSEKIMQELKSAYVSVLHEKEEQIMQLKNEIADLKTLVQVLEGENGRLNSNLSEAAPIDSWLEENL